MKSELLFGRRNIPSIMSASDRYDSEVRQIILKDGSEDIEFSGPAELYMEERERRISQKEKAYYEIYVQMPDGSIGAAAEVIVSEAVLGGETSSALYRGTISKVIDPKAMEALYRGLC